jgi:hypothetical protein
MEAMLEGALEVAEDALHNNEVGLTGVVHVKAHLLDHVGDVEPGEGEVLESPSQAMVGNRVGDRGTHIGGDLGLTMVGSRVGDRGTHVEGDLGLSVDRRGLGLAVAHARALKDIPSVLTLVLEEVVVSLLQ